MTVHTAKTDAQTKRRIRAQKQVEKAAQAHSNLNMFAAIVSMLESGCIYPTGTAPKTAQKIIEFCLKEQQAQLRIYERVRGGE